MKSEEKQSNFLESQRISAGQARLSWRLRCWREVFTLRRQQKRKQPDQTEYEIYPTPHVMTYEDGDYIIRDEVNVGL